MNDFDAPFTQNCYQPPRATAFRILLKATVCALAVFGLLFILLLALIFVARVAARISEMLM